MSLITLATYKALTNTTSTDNDVVLTSLLDIVSNQIEKYTDRIFLSDTYYQWCSTENCTNSISPLEYPIIKVLMSAYEDKALTVTNGYSDPVTISIENNILTITDNGDLSTEEYDLTDVTLDTLAELVAVIETDWSGLTFTINPLACTKSITLKPNTYGINVNDIVDINGAIPSTNSIKIQSNMLYVNGVTSYSDGYNLLIVYKAGYDTIPSDLQYVCAQITKDTLGVVLASTDGGTTNLKSQTITNYSYTLADNVSLQTIISGYIGEYGSTLDYYRRISF